MTKKEFLTLQKKLLPSFPEFIARGDMMYLPPDNGLLRAISFQSSAFSKDDFYVQWFVMPLCVPSKYITLGFGERLRIDGKIDGWQGSLPVLESQLSDAIKKQAMPRLNETRGLAEFVGLTYRSQRNVRDIESRVYSLIRIGRSTDAIQDISGFLDTADFAPIYQWEHHLRNELQALLRKLEQGFDRALEHVLRVEAETRANLKLPGIPLEQMAAVIAGAR